MGSQKQDIWVVMPAYNEAEIIRSVVAGVIKHGYSLVVVDDASIEPVGELLADYKVTVLRHIINLGQGAALQTGIKYALSKQAHVIVTFDADGQHNADEIEKLCQPILNKQAEVCLGTRFSSGGKAIDIPLARQLILKLAVIFTRITTGLTVTDTHNGFRAFSRQAAQKLEITQNRMAHASQILAQIASYNLSYKEIPTQIIYTDYSLAKGQKISNFINVLWDSFWGALRS